jgi:GDP/UDP-N,N'-diacetylbacillosamine 2-epimerase (hydrolysing)
MPNADTEGSLFRNEFSNLKSKYNSTIHLIENFGTRAYFTCMKHAKFLLGNSSSGIIEAASFNKYVINLGDRQKGRLHGNNVINIPFQKDLVLHQIEKIKQKGDFQGENIYYLGGAVSKIMGVLNKEFGV